MFLLIFTVGNLSFVDTYIHAYDLSSLSSVLYLGFNSLIKADSNTKDSISLFVSTTSIFSIYGIIFFTYGLSYRVSLKYDLTLFLRFRALPM